MLKINQFYWQLYKESPSGCQTIKIFEQLMNGSANPSQYINLLEKFQPQYFLNANAEWASDNFECASALVRNSRYLNLAGDVDYQKISDFFDRVSENLYDGYRNIISLMEPISLILYSTHPDNFFPYLFSGQYKFFVQILEDFDIEIDAIPGKGSMADRCKYYLNICKALKAFKDLNGLSSPELCAFLYDMQKKAYESRFSEDAIPFPKVWMISGTKKSEEEANNPILGWQCNANTRKGDILIFYENGGTWYKENNSSITGIWTALSDGDVDPLSYYYGNAIIGNEVKIKPIPFRIISKDERLNKLPRCNARFMGLHGDPVDTNKYENLLSFIEEWDSHFDRNKLPKLHEPFKLKVAYNDRGDMKREKWVEEYLIKEMLEQMGWNREDVDYCRQVHLQMGRKKMENEKVQDGKTDFSLFPFGPKLKRADVLIEAKAPGEMDGNDIEKAFWQAESYASHQYAGLIILADGEKVILYPRDKKEGVFKFRSDAKSYLWENIFHDIETFNALRSEILKYKVHNKH